MKEQKKVPNRQKSWAREVAFLAFHHIVREGGYSNLELKNRLNRADLNRQDRALVTEVVNGTLRHLIQIDYVLRQFVRKNNGRHIDTKVEDILRCGVYQILFLDRIPDSAVCNESVELGKKHVNDGAAKLINGVLRNFIRNKETILYPAQSNQIEYFSVKYSYPSWLVKKWIGDYGIEFAEALLTAGNMIAPLCIRTNTLQLTRDALAEHLGEAGFSVSAGMKVPEALYINRRKEIRPRLKTEQANDERISQQAREVVGNGGSIEATEAYRKGEFQIQDESSMMVAHILGARPGEFVVDVCSAPGGKTTHIAQLMQNQGTIVARDLYLHKLELIQNNCTRLGIQCVHTEQFDAAVKDGTLFDRADRVLVDAPCSGFGIIRKKPDIKYHMTPDKLKTLLVLQEKILKNASCYVKPGGTLVYSTCTINRDENEVQIERFLKQNPSFVLESIDAISGVDGSRGWIQLYPHINGTDGFFIAKMKRQDDDR